MSAQRDSPPSGNGSGSPRGARKRTKNARRKVDMQAQAERDRTTPRGQAERDREGRESWRREHEAELRRRADARRRERERANTKRERPTTRRRPLGEAVLDPLPLVFLLLLIARRAGLHFDLAWPLALDAPLAHRRGNDVEQWGDVLGATRCAWRDAYEGRRSRLMSLPG